MKLKEYLYETVDYYEATTDDQMLREAIEEEYRAANLYEKMAKKATNSKVRKVLLDIAEEEKVHIGEFEQLLEELDSEHGSANQEGKEEVENMK